MKHWLKDGIHYTGGNNKHAGKVFLCTCDSYGCKGRTVIKEGSSVPIRGTWVGAQELATHKAADRNLRNLAALSPQSEAEDSSIPNLQISSQQPTNVSRPPSPRHLQKALDRILCLQAEFRAIEQRQVLSNDLVFKTLPHADVEVPSPPTELTLNTGPYALLVDSPYNSEFLSFKEDLWNLIARIEGLHRMEVTQDFSDGLKCAAEQRFHQLREAKVHEWRRQSQLLQGVDHEALSSGSHSTRSWAHVNPIVTLAYMLLGVLHFMCGLSMANCNFVLHVIRKVLKLAYLSHGRPQVEDQRVLNSFPRDVWTVFHSFDVESDTVHYVCCPKCFKCYLFDPDKLSSYPARCTNKPTLTGDVCNRTLRKSRTIKGVEYSHPTRQFIYHDMKKWVGRLLLRPGMENVLDRKYAPSLAPEDAPPGFCDDILGSKALQDFLGPDGKPFLASPSTLVFSLSMDGFNPYRMSEAGKKVSVGAIYMVCLNLLPEIRYRFENMYLFGVIPGPSEPSLDQINYLLKPLVDDLLVFWDPGIYYTHTSNHPLGRWIYCTLLPLVCNLPAAHKMSGFASYSATHFCSMCMQKLSQMDDTDVSKWKRRTCKQHRKWVKQWQEAPSDAAQAKLVRKTGVRYSYLLQLPYWDLTLFTFIDSMHAFFLGNLKYHCREVWGMDVKLADGDGVWTDPGAPGSSLPSDLAIKKGWRHLRMSSTSALKKQTTVSVLQYLCRETQTLPVGWYMNSKDHLVKALVKYRTDLGWFDEDDNLIEHPDPSNTLPVPLPEQITAAREALRSYSKSAFIREFSKPAVAGLWVSIFKKTDAKAKAIPKVNLVKELIQWRIDQGWTDASGNVLVDKYKHLQAQPPKKTVVLGKNVISEIWKDMDRTQLPLWIAPAPAQIGTSKTGKLSADQWRTAATVHLVVTLVQLWGHKSPHSRRYKMLKNFMDLVTATKLATLRTMSSSRVSLFSFHMKRYLDDLLELYPNIRLTPNHHMSLHFDELLERFGPTHGWCG